MSIVSKLFRKARRWLTWKRITPNLPKEMQRELRDILSVLKDTGEAALTKVLTVATLGEWDKLESLFKSELKSILHELSELDDELKDWVIRALWAIALDQLRRKLADIAAEHPVPQEPS